METIFTGDFSEPGAVATAWADTERVLQGAELYWLTTVRTDGRPHVTPLVGLWLDGAACFTTGHAEQKSRNLEHSPLVALTTGDNTWASGLDVVVEGTAQRVRGTAALERAARAYVDKYGEAWRFEVTGDELTQGGHPSGLFRVAPAKVIAFAKDPHAQTTYRF
jgi:nitroimidazol reductase NimA-like FMN-containing flavoprotein (pyridoxamine 5'-phosphate oxidase superfamily)